jgi:uncharacterized membrane protein YjgN (DUF898 family)
MDIQSSNQPAQPASASPGGARLTWPHGQEVSFTFTGTGGEFFAEAIVGLILNMITFGLYSPWLMVRLQRYFYSRTTLNAPSGPLSLSFTGTGALCFIEVYLRMILVFLTFGIYTPWYLAGVLRFFMNNTVATAKDGRQYRLGFEGTGGELFLPMFLGTFLSAITFGIYTPWYECGLRRLIMTKAGIYSGNEQVGRLEFVGTGGGLIGTYLLGMILTTISLGLYAPWFQVSLNQFFLRNTGVHIGDKAYRGDYTGTGLGVLLLMLQMILIPLTLGIYMFWFVVNARRYATENTKFIPA